MQTDTTAVMTEGYTYSSWCTNTYNWQKKFMWTKTKMERPTPMKREQALNALYPVAALVHE
jgi:hypothetical protein